MCDGGELVYSVELANGTVMCLRHLTKQTFILKFVKFCKNLRGTAEKYSILWLVLIAAVILARLVTTDRPVISYKIGPMDR